MARKERQHRRRKKNQRKMRNQSEKPLSSVSWHWYAIVIVSALILFGVFIATQFDPIDRLPMVAASMVCAGIAFLIIGTCSAVGNFDFDDDSRIQKCLGFFAVSATPRRRFRGLFYTRSAPNVFFEKILIAIVLPLGFILAFLRPQQTWPAILWIGSGLLAILGTCAAAVVFDSQYY